MHVFLSGSSVVSAGARTLAWQANLIVGLRSGTRTDILEVEAGCPTFGGSAQAKEMRRCLVGATSAGFTLGCAAWLSM